MRKSGWVTSALVAEAAQRLLLQHRGNAAAINANMVAVALGKPKANKTIYRHFDRWQQGRVSASDSVNANQHSQERVAEVRTAADESGRDLRADIDVLLEVIDDLEGELAAMRMLVRHYEARSSALTQKGEPMPS